VGELGRLKQPCRWQVASNENMNVVRKDHEEPITPEMMQALLRGERPSFPDGTNLPKRIAVSSDGHWVDATPSVRERIVFRIRRMTGSERTIRMAPDYGVEVPLWPQADETDALVPDDLLHKLISWQAYWESHHSWDRGWDSEDSMARWRKEGSALAAEVKDALPRPWKLKVDF
jgi:hypothetical protein